ncbi:methylated-DNA--[protein]-cysteine S-methyltransferase [Millionella massiliensis]|uniref:methylated-DNA--[protein]-cysteine S-methyltransferase n=1 Tax=Millionella massiliensis TaxID=1871023 RepID=UPI0024B6F009|nr:methylated-DNA--[protein]-cysteine S-methyltransferase [Millionella massiliensis]
MMLGFDATKMMGPIFTDISANCHLIRGIVETPLGNMQALVLEKGVVMCDFVDRSEIAREMSGLMRMFPGCRVVDGEHPCLEQLRVQFAEYFGGKRTEFRIPLHLVGTPFQVRVWQALLQIPYGTTITYAQQARMIGNPAAVRAVASANGRNRLPILVPCHRVIGADGSLTGYSGGIERKAELLRLERRFML